MPESSWHKQVREEVHKSKPNSYTSHANISKLEMYTGNKKRENCLSDVDIVVLDSKNENIMELIEIETAMNPKKLIGIVLATHFCDSCTLRMDQKPSYVQIPIKGASLTIICRKEKDKSKKHLKLEVIKAKLDDIISTTKGSLSHFHFEIRP